MDHISNLLTSVRNAELAGHASLEAPHSKLSAAVLEILKKQGYVSSFEITGEKGKQRLSVALPQPVKRNHYKGISTPGQRIYTPYDKIPMVLRGLGFVIISTSKGLMTGRDAKRQHLGGEMIAEIY